MRATPTGHVVQLRDGRLVRSGTGLAFWFWPLSAVLSEVPVDDRELPLVAHARTADLQEVAVQVTVSYRFTQPELAAGRLDFGIDPHTGEWTATPLDQIGQQLSELATGHVMDAMAGLRLHEAVAVASGPLGERIGAALQADDRVTAGLA